MSLISNEGRRNQAGGSLKWAEPEGFEESGALCDHLIRFIFYI